MLIFFFSLTVLLYTTRSDIDIKPHIKGVLSPGFSIMDTNDDGGLCLRFDQSYELSNLGENQCLIPDSSKVPSSVRKLSGPGWTVVERDDDNVVILNQNRATTGAKSFAYRVNKNSDDDVKYSFTLDGYNFVGGSTKNFYVLELTLGMCGDSVVKNLKSDTSKATKDSKSTTSATKNSAETKSSADKVSRSATKDSKGVVLVGSGDQTTQGDDGATNGSGDGNTGANDATTGGSGDGTTGADDGTSGMKSSPDATSTSTDKDSGTSTSTSIDKNSVDETSTSVSKDKDDKDDESRGVKRRISATSKAVIATFLQSVKSTITCDVQGQDVRRVTDNVVCISNSGTKFRMIVANFHGCRVVQSPTAGLNAGAVIAKEIGNESGVMEEVKLVVYTMVVLIGVVFLL